MTIRSVNDAPTPPGSPARVDMTLVAVPEASVSTPEVSVSTPEVSISAPEVGVESPTSAETPVVRIHSMSSPEAETPDTTRYDSAWTSTEIPSKEPQGFESFMVGGGKIYVVLAVVLIIWIGLLAFLFSTDRRIRSLERDAD